MSVGVNVTDWLAVPAPGDVADVVKAKLPATEALFTELVAAPPLKLELVSV